MQTVPGHMDGEKRKEQLAVIRQPRARPALLWLRRADGIENDIAKAIDATVSVIRMIAKAEIEGGVASTTDERTAISASRTPAVRVMLVSPTEQFSGEVAAGVLRDHGTDPDAGEGAFESYRGLKRPDIVGSGGCSTKIEIVSAW